MKGLWTIEHNGSHINNVIHRRKNNNSISLNFVSVFAGGFFIKKKKQILKSTESYEHYFHIFGVIKNARRMHLRSYHRIRKYYTHFDFTWMFANSVKKHSVCNVCHMDQGGIAIWKDIEQLNTVFWQIWY